MDVSRAGYAVRRETGYARPTCDKCATRRYAVWQLARREKNLRKKLKNSLHWLTNTV